MNVVGITKDGVTHEWIDGKWVPPVVAPAHIHEQIVRKLNANEEARQHERVRQEEANKKGSLKE